ncbi:MAG: DUF1934 domain-containing protein [Clostridiales bacterium]|nr:DUF1934 domain-containing protein [Clostridiales bacterium]
MKKHARIYVLDKDDQFTAIFLGTVEDSNTGYYIEYEDSEGVTCVIGYSKGIATITRTAEPVYTLVLEEGAPHAFRIETPYGNIEAAAHPITVRSRNYGNKRTITLVYDLILGKEKMRHTLKLKVELLE